MLMPISRTVPTINAPTSAPSRLPRPPVTTTMKERTSASTPIPSTADWLGTMMAPPSPAMKQPIEKGRLGPGEPPSDRGCGQERADRKEVPVREVDDPHHAVDEG